MNNTKNTVLFVLLVLQVALIAFLYRPGQNAAPAAANLFKSLVPDQVTALTITDDQGKAIAVIKKEGWQISQGDFPADQAKIEGLLKKLADVKTSRLVTQTPGSHARLKVAESDFNRKVELSQGDTKTVFFLGTAPSAKSIHLRLLDAKEVYQINDLAAWEVQTEKETWWQTKYLSQPAANLTGLTIANPAGTIDLSFDAAKKAWQLKDSPEQTLDGKRVEALLNAVSDITITSYLAKDASPKGQPLATVTYQAKEGAPTTLQIWAKDKPEDGDQVIKASSSAFAAKAKEYAVKEALEIKRQALIATPVEGAAADPAPPLATEQAVPPVTTPPDK